MKIPIVKIETSHITDWETFHAVFAEAFGFPDFYGRNMNAWIDCMSSLDEPADGLTTIHTLSGSVMTIQLEQAETFAQRCPEQYNALIECTAFVNWRRIEVGGSSVLSLSFHKQASHEQEKD